LWGIGVRDSALVWLFHDVASPASMAAVGLLTTSRYLVPGLVGVFCVTSLRLRGSREPESADRVTPRKRSTPTARRAA
jgi:hypothetical protein